MKPGVFAIARRNPVSLRNRVNFSLAPFPFPFPFPLRVSAAVSAALLLTIALEFPATAQIRTQSEEFFNQGRNQFEREVQRLTQEGSDALLNLNKIQSLKSVGDNVEIELFSSKGFPVINDLYILRIGGKEFTLNNYPKGDTHRLIYKLNKKEFASVASGDNVQVCQQSASTCNWDFGKLDKRLLDR